MQKKRLHSIYGILLSVCTVMSGLLLILACISIYRMGEHPFTPETVASAFTSIALPVYICIALILGGFILDSIRPAPDPKLVPEKDLSLILEKLYAKHGVVETPALRTLRRKRRVRAAVTSVLLTAGCAVFLFYGLDSRNFDSADITGSVVKAMYVLLPCVTVAVAACICAVYRNRAGLRQEIALVKEAVAAGDHNAAPVVTKASRSFPGALRWALLAVGIFLLVYGFVTGGTQDVLTKAVNICTECVGLG